jgi:hypothetical protein
MPTHISKEIRDTRKFEVLTEVTMKSSTVWDITPCSQRISTDESEECIASIFRVEEPAKQRTGMTACCPIHACSLLGLLINLVDGGEMFLRNVGWPSPDYMMLCPRRQNSSIYIKYLKNFLSILNLDFYLHKLHNNLRYVKSLRSRKPRLTTVGISCADHAAPSIRKSWHYFANKRRSLGRPSSLADQSHGV